MVSRIKHEEPRKDKQTDKLVYHRVRKWELSELRLVDGKSSDTEVSMRPHVCLLIWISSSMYV